MIGAVLGLVETRVPKMCSELRTQELGISAVSGLRMDYRLKRPPQESQAHVMSCDQLHISFQQTCFCTRVMPREF